MTADSLADYGRESTGVINIIIMAALHSDVPFPELCFVHAPSMLLVAPVLLPVMLSQTAAKRPFPMMVCGVLFNFSDSASHL